MNNIEKEIYMNGYDKGKYDTLRALDRVLKIKTDSYLIAIIIEDVLDELNLDEETRRN